MAEYACAGILGRGHEIGHGIRADCAVVADDVLMAQAACCHCLVGVGDNETVEASAFG